MNFDKQKLLERAKENREMYIKQYNTTLKAYQAAAKVVLQDALKNTDSLCNNGLRLSSPDTNVSLQSPMLNIAQHDGLIAMLEQTDDDTIDLADHNYARYHLGEWTWVSLEESQQEYEDIIGYSQYSRED